MNARPKKVLATTLLVDARAGSASFLSTTQRASHFLATYKRQRQLFEIARGADACSEQVPDRPTRRRAPSLQHSPTMVLTGPLLLLLVTLASRAAAFSLAAGTHAARAPTNAPVAMVLQQPSTRNTQTFDTQLEALFYSFDADSNGSIDQGEFESAIDELGFALSKERVGELFTEFDADDSGTITLDEFKTLVSQTGLAPSPRLKYAMDLFKRYDVDASGSIDKFEFKQIAAEIEADQSRRTFLACGAAALGSLVVAKYSEEYQWAQKTFRGLYLEPKAEAAQHAAFPTALLSSDLDSAVARTLGSRGYTPSNTLFAHSVCSDEVNNKDEQLVDLMVSRWGEGFALGGLGGLPFAGKSGFRAYLHHVPDSGRLLVLFAPHVGIDAEGRIGSLQREGQTALSKACGAAVGAYKAVSAKKASAAPAAPAASAVVAEADAGLDPFDPELKTIVSARRAHQRHRGRARPARLRHVPDVRDRARPRRLVHHQHRRRVGLCEPGRRAGWNHGQPEGGRRLFPAAQLRGAAAPQGPALDRPVRADVWQAARPDDGSRVGGRRDGDVHKERADVVSVWSRAQSRIRSLSRVRLTQQLTTHFATY